MFGAMFFLVYLNIITWWKHPIFVIGIRLRWICVQLSTLLHVLAFIQTHSFGGRMHITRAIIPRNVISSIVNNSHSKTLPTRHCMQGIWDMFLPLVHWKTQFFKHICNVQHMPYGSQLHYGGFNSTTIGINNALLLMCMSWALCSISVGNSWWLPGTIS